MRALRDFATLTPVRWYDAFAGFYDASLEHLYADARHVAVEALDPREGLVVLDAPCGTGQSLDRLSERVSDRGLVLGVDRSDEMLGRARRRVEKRRLANVRVAHGDVHAIDAAFLVEHGCARGVVDRLHVFLGLSTMPDYAAAFERLWHALAPGGRAVVVDVHAENPGLQGRLVNLIARADIRRRFWEPFERVAVDFERHELPPKRAYGGALLLFCANKPGG